MDVEIRLLEEADIAPIALQFQFPWISSLDSALKWALYYKEQQNKERIACVLLCGDSFIGYGSLLFSSMSSHLRKENIPEINDIWIHADYRKKGYGQSLILHLESLAKNLGYSEIGIGVGLYDSYGSAQRLYHKLGYKPTGTGITYHGLPVTPGQSYPVDDDLLLWLTKSI